MLAELELLFALIAVTAGAVVMGTVSFGFGLVVSPFLLLFLDAQPTVVASFGSPYLLSQLSTFVGTYLLAWNAVAANEHAVARALAAGAAITGTSPITLSDRFPRGHGIQLPAR